MSKPKGFAAMSPEQQREIARQGGEAAHRNGTAHEFTQEEARAAGKKGGVGLIAKRGSAYMAEIGRRGGKVVASKPGHMAAIGRKGGARVAENLGHMREIGIKGGLAVSADSQHMADIGRVGGQKRHAKPE